MGYLGNQITTVFPTSISVDSATIKDDVTVDTSTLKVDSSNNRVGVGNDTPLAVLDVKGSTDSFAGMAKVYLTDVTTNSDSRNWSVGNGGSAYGNFTISKSKVKDGNPSDSGTADNTLIIDNAGHITMPLQPAFMAKASSDQLNLNNTSAHVTLQFATEIFDQNADYNNSTYIFTAPITGRYQLSFNIYLNNIDTAATFFYVTLKTSNRDVFFIVDPNFSADLTYYHVAGSLLSDMDANDTAQITYVQASGTAQTDANAHSYFSGYLVC